MTHPDDPPVDNKLVQALRELARPIYRGDLMETELGRRILPVLEAAEKHGLHELEEFLGGKR